MTWLEALILGIIQGLTEFLPVSSSGHLEIGKALLGVEIKEDLTFTVVVHLATVLSTIVVFRKEIVTLISDLFKFQWNESTQYISKIAISMIPVIIVGLTIKDFVSGLFGGKLLLVGAMLLITAGLLAFTYYFKPKEKKISYLDAFLIGLAQAFAVIPGISRSGSTIATGLILGNKKDETAKFSFLMVLIPIIGVNAMDILGSEESLVLSGDIIPLVIGFIAAFFSGLLACKLMINIVKKGKLIYFAIYCAAVGTLTMILS